MQKLKVYMKIQCRTMRQAGGQFQHFITCISLLPEHLRFKQAFTACMNNLQQLISIQ